MVTAALWHVTSVDSWLDPGTTAPPPRRSRSPNPKPRGNEKGLRPAWQTLCAPASPEDRFAELLSLAQSLPASSRSASWDASPQAPGCRIDACPRSQDFRNTSAAEGCDHTRMLLVRIHKHKQTRHVRMQAASNLHTITRPETCAAARFGSTAMTPSRAALAVLVGAMEMAPSPRWPQSGVSRRASMIADNPVTGNPDF